MNMLDGLLQYNKVHGLIGADTKVVLALSGGIDSMVLAHLLLRMEATFVVAHCNFQLRGAESDGDERFVGEFAQRYGIPCHVRHFDTEAYAKKQGVSIEMAARDLRYAWFEDLRKQLDFDKIALAHHADDQIETFFINLFRGAGINGLKGMRPQNGVLIRPLLWASREQIKQYAIENQIVWRDDHTNAESVYLRNKIRNELMPVVDAIDAGARTSIGKSIENLSAENGLYRHLLQRELASMVAEDAGIQSVKKTVFRSLDGFQRLFEWLRQYGFNTEQCRFVYDALGTGQGKRFLSPTHCLSVERETLQLRPTNSSDHEPCLIEKGMECLVNPFEMRFSSYEIGDGFVLDKSRKVAMFDADKLQFPMTLRHWRQGDRFCPLGMGGSKLLSDFFVDKKFTNAQKERQWLLVNGNGDIIWVVGCRLDDRYKVTKSSKNVFECDLNV